MMKPFRVFAWLCAALWMTAAACAQVNAAQRVTLAGLRANGAQGKFPAAAFAPDGGLVTLYDQGDGVRVLKLNAAGTAVLAEARLGAAGDAALALALDPAGNVYVTGTSTSGQLNGTAGAAFATRADGSTNSFLAKFDSSLRTVFVTFLGVGRTAATGVAATADGAFVTGITFSAAFPVTAGGVQQAPAFAAGTENGFVERFRADGSALVYATYLSGSNGTTAPAAIAVDSTGSAYVAGSTSASGYPTMAALVPLMLGETSGFVTRLTAAGDGFVFSTFVPGDGLTGLALDESEGTLLASGSVTPGQFPVATASGPLSSAGYQSLLVLGLDGQSVPRSSFLVPGSGSLVTRGVNGSAWVAGTLTTPLFPGSSQPLAMLGDSFAVHVTRDGTLDQTVRLGGQAARSFSLGTLSSQAGAPAVTADGGTVALPATLTVTVDGTLAAATRFDLPLVQAPNAALPTSLRDLAAACPASGQCAATAGYLSLLTSSSGASLSVSADDLPNVTVRNLGSAAANGVMVTATGYSVASNCGTTLEPSNACVVALTGAGPGTLTVAASNAAAQTMALPANAMAADPLAVLPAELDFGVVAAGSAAVRRTFTVSNLSGAAQTFSSALDSLARSTPFLLAETAIDCATTGTGAKLLAAGSSCHITLGLSVAAGANADGDVRTAWKAGNHDVRVTGYVQLASVNVSSSSIDFGTHFSGGVVLPRYLFLSNNSSGPVTHAKVSLPPQSVFRVQDDCPGTLAPASVCRLAIVYTATAAPATDSVTLTLDGGVSVPVTGRTLPAQTVSGSAANPAITVSPAALAFASPVVVSGVSGSAQSVTVRNTGATAQSVSVAITGDFAVQNGCPAVLAAGASCTLLVSFTPAQPGQRSGLLAITAGTGFAPDYVTLAGTASPILPPNNGVLDLGRTLAGEPVVAYYKLQQSLPVVTFTSNSAAFRVALVEDDGTGHGSVAASAFAPSVTASCGNCYLAVQFLARTAGVQVATLSATTVAAGVAYTVQLQGTAVSATGLVLSPVTQDFGVVPVHSASGTRLFRLADLLGTGAAVTVNSVAASGDFSVAANDSGGPGCAGMVAATASCFVQLRFAPTAVGDRTGALTIATSAGTVTAMLSGFGLADPGVALNPVELSFRAAPGGQSTAQSVTVTNTGAAPVTVGAVSTTDASFTAASGCGVLAPGAACMVEVRFAPGGAETSGRVQIPVSATVNGQTTETVYTVALAGTYTTEDARLLLLPGEVNFGAVDTGSAGPTQQLTLVNLTSSTKNVVLGLPRQFPLVGANNCTLLAANASCTFQVTFVPAVGGVATGTVTATGTATDGSGTSQTRAYMQGFGTAAGALTLSGNLVPNAPLRFGQVTSGQQAQQVLTVHNAGTSLLTVRRVHSDPPFLATTTCGAALGANDTCAVTVTYAPVNETAASTGGAAASTGGAAARTDAGSVAIESDAASSPDVVAVSGSVAPVMAGATNGGSVLATYTLSQGALTFGDAAAGGRSATQTVVLTNTGNVTLSLLGTQTSSDFQATTDCGSVLPGEACRLNVAFTPANGSAVGARNGALEIRSNGSTPLEFVTLTGSISAGTLTLTPAALDFATLNVGSSSVLSVMLSNMSGSAVTLRGVTATGDYGVANGTCPAVGGTLAASANCTLMVSFRPAAEGVRTGTLAVASDATTLPLTVSLTGIGATAKLQLTTGTLAFGPIAVGASGNISLTLTNTGTAAVTGIGTALAGVNAGDFAVTTPCSATTLAPNQGCTVTVTFTPTAQGARSATLRVISSDAASPATVLLTGSGASPGSFTLTADGGATASRTVRPGTRALYSLVVTPVNGFTGTVALTCAPVNAGIYASCSLDPSTVTLAGGPTSATVTINTITTAELTMPRWSRVVLAWLWLPLFLLRRKRTGPKRLLVFAVALASGALLGMTGCGNGDSSLRFTPAGTYQYTVTATSTSGTQITQSVTLNLTVQ